MKKLFIILLSIGSCFSAFSQEKGSFDFGINVGYNGATVTSGSNTNSSVRSGFNVGALADYYFSDRWSIKTKLTYDQKGWDNGYFTNFDNGQSFQTNYRLDYLTVPVMANWHFGKKRNWYLNFGPYAGFLVSAKETRLDLDLKEVMNSIDVGLALGIGIKFPISDRVKILLEIDGQSGFTDIIKDNQGSAINNSRSSVNTGLIFAL